MQTLRQLFGDWTVGPQDGSAPPLHGWGSPQSEQDPYYWLDPQSNSGDAQNPQTVLVDDE